MMGRRLPRRQRGYALLAVMFIGAAAMLGVSTLAGDDMVAERRAQDLELLKLRVYWAEMGQLSYVLSRAREGPPCGTKTCTNKLKRATYYQDVIDEFYNANKGVFKGISQGGQRLWEYPELGADYFFVTGLHVHNDAAGSRMRFRNLQEKVNGLTHPFILEHWPPQPIVDIFVCLGLIDAQAACPGAEAAMDEDSGIGRIVEAIPR